MLWCSAGDSTTLPAVGSMISCDQVDFYANMTPGLPFRAFFWSLTVSCETLLISSFAFLHSEKPKKRSHNHNKVAKSLLFIADSMIHLCLQINFIVNWIFHSGKHFTDRKHCLIKHCYIQTACITDNRSCGLDNAVSDKKFKSYSTMFPVVNEH